MMNQKSDCLFNFIAKIFFTMKHILLTSVLFVGLIGFSQNIDIKHYELSLYVPNSYNTYIEGATRIDLRSSINNLTHFELMLQGLIIDSIKCEEQTLSYTHNDTIIDIQLGASYQTNDSLSVTVYYHGNAKADPSGWGGYLSQNGIAYNLGVSMVEDPHGYGRVWYPCIEDFNEKATYNFNIRCQEQRTAVCGGTLVNETVHGDGTKTYNWQLPREIPTYIVSIAVGNFQVYRDTFAGLEGQIPVAIYVPAAILANVPGSFANLEQGFHMLENRFGAYRWSRIGFVGIPFTGGAMEHAENIGYPSSTITGNNTYETLYAHELSHHWFGNLVTCSTQGDMWMNEGWARYVETIFKEELYGLDAAKIYNRDRHHENLKDLHIQEGGYLPLYNMPVDLTYSSHVYEKGADVVQSLRTFLGDQVFYPTMTNYLNQYQFSTASSYNLRDYINNHTTSNVTGFFDAWVFEGGWLHFAIDSFLVEENGGAYHTTVYVREKLKGRTEFGFDQRIPIQFFGSNGQRIDSLMTVDGATDHQTFVLPFEPIAVFCDLDEEVADATIDQFDYLKTTGSKTYSKEFFKTNVTQLSDSIMFRIQHHWVAADDFSPSNPEIMVNPFRYWSVEGIWNQNFRANGQFYYNRSSSGSPIDYGFISTIDSVVVLYRAKVSDQWAIVPHTKSGSSISGYLIVDTLKIGEYAFGVRNRSLKINPTGQYNGLKAYPNPVTHFYVVSLEQNQTIESAECTDMQGRTWDIEFTKIGNDQWQCDMSQLQKGTYSLLIHSGENTFNLNVIKE